MKNLAPIGISTYSRINHLKRTIEALKKNTLAMESELYIFSDAPKEGDEEIVKKVRNYLQTINGFKKVHILERETNGRIANNRGGIQQLLERYGKMIFMEEDIVTAPGFLQFINDGLEFYETDKDILSISGYKPPIQIPLLYKKNSFVLQRFSAWGFATWKDKFDYFDFDVHRHGVDEFLENKKEIKKFMQNGQDMYEMLLLEASEKIDALDVKVMFYQYKYNKYTVYPVESLVQNIGHDGSGMHCGSSDKFYHKELWDKINDFEFVKNIQVNEKIRKLNYNFRRIGIKGNIFNFTKRIGIYPLLKIIKDKF